MLWIIPAFISIVISSAFLYKLNLKKRKNRIKVAFSTYLTLLIIFDVLSIVRHIITEIDLLLVVSRAAITTGIFGTAVFLVTSIIMYSTKRAKIAYIIFIPSTLLSIWFWNPSSIYRAGMDVRYGYGIKPFLHMIYIMYQSISYVLISTFLFLTYRKYRDEKFGHKIKYFFLASILGFFTVILGRMIVQYVGTLPLIHQTILPTTAVVTMMYGYFKR